MGVGVRFPITGTVVVAHPLQANSIFKIKTHVMIFLFKISPQLILLNPFLFGYLLYIILYLPMQNLEKIISIRSSPVSSPMISPSLE